MFQLSSNRCRSGIAHNGSRLADVIEKELKAKLIQMQKKLQELIDKWKLKVENGKSEAKKMAQREIYELSGFYIAQCQAISTCIADAELLLNSESENSGKNDADNSGKPM